MSNDDPLVDKVILGKQATIEIKTPDGWTSLEAAGRKIEEALTPFEAEISEWKTSLPSFASAILQVDINPAGMAFLEAIIEGQRRAEEARMRARIGYRPNSYSIPATLHLPLGKTVDGWLSVSANSVMIAIRKRRFANRRRTKIYRWVRARREAAGLSPM